MKKKQTPFDVYITFGGDIKIDDSLSPEMIKYFEENYISDKIKYYVKNVSIPKEIWHNRYNLDFSEIMKQDNVEVRAVLCELQDPEELFYKMKPRPQLIHEGKKGSKLYHCKALEKNLGTDIKIKILTFSDPSTGKVYYHYAESDAVDADECTAIRHGLTKDEYLNNVIET